MEKWKNNNKPMRRKSDFAVHNEEEMWAYLCTIKAFFGHFFGTYYLLGSLWADC
jgi:heme/copper-type cytochrome/quinol oxidase subunit 3